MNRVLLNTLYVQTQGAYVHLDHETLKVEHEGTTLLQMPLHHLSGLTVFGQVMVSPFLIAKLSEEGKSLNFFTKNGRFSGRVCGPISGNVLLRRSQYALLQDAPRRLKLAREFVAGKIKNSRNVLLRAKRDDPELEERLAEPVAALEKQLTYLFEASTLDEVRGAEGIASAYYFAALAHLIRNPSFTFFGRNRRPPRDPVNAMLSFLYSVLSNDVAGGLEGAGLDPQVGYLHALRPGRVALALDLMEEFRSWFADRTVLSLINRHQVDESDFSFRAGGSVSLNEEGRKKVLVAYQKRKQEELSHPLFKSKVPIGLTWHVQARILARYIRGDLDTYAAFVPR